MVEEQKKAREAGDPAAIDKHGSFTGHYAINPFSGERVPIWVANYILLEYGTGAVMSVPAHDERDLRVCQKIWSRSAHRGFAPAQQASRPAPVSPTSRFCPTPKKTAC